MRASVRILRRIYFSCGMEIRPYIQYRYRKNFQLTFLNRDPPHILPILSKACPTPIHFCIGTKIQGEASSQCYLSRLLVGLVQQTEGEILD